MESEVPKRGMVAWQEEWSIKKEEVETGGKNQRKGLDGEGGSDGRGVRGSKERRAAE